MQSLILYMKWAYYELLTHDINSMDSGSAIRTIDKARDSAASAGSLFLWPAWYCNHFATIAPFSYLYEPPGQNKMDDYIVYIALEVLPPKQLQQSYFFARHGNPNPIPGKYRSLLFFRVYQLHLLKFLVCSTRNVAIL